MKKLLTDSMDLKKRMELQDYGQCVERAIRNIKVKQKITFFGPARNYVYLGGVIADGMICSLFDYIIK